MAKKIVLGSNGASSHAANIVSLVLSRREAAEVIALLAARLSGESLRGFVSGACPEINISDQGVVVERVLLTLESDLPHPE